MKTPETKSKKGKTQAPSVSPYLPIRLTKTEKPYVERVHDEIKAHLRRLHEGVQASPTDEEKLKCVVALADVAIQATRILESLYGSGSEAQRQFVRKVALSGEKFVGIYDFRLPSALRALPREDEPRGDQMRRAFTKEWQAKTLLKVSDKNDALRLVLEGFVKAVIKPPSLDHEPSGKPNLALDLFLEHQGVIFISPEVRTALLEPKALKDPAKWAHAFAGWYESRHPLPSDEALDDATNAGMIYGEIVESSRRNRLGKKTRAFQKHYRISPEKFLKLTDAEMMKVRDGSVRGGGEQFSATKATRVKQKAVSILQDTPPTQAEFRRGLFEATLVRLKTILRK